MTDPLTRQRISDVVDPLGWRLILGVAVTHVRVPSLAEAAEAAAVADRRPTGVRRAPDASTCTPTASCCGCTPPPPGSVTEHDLELAARVTEALAAAGSARPGRATATRCRRPSRSPSTPSTSPLIRPFWQAVTGYVDEPGPPDLPDGAPAWTRSAAGPPIWFQQMDAPRPQRNRIHLDVDVPPERGAAAHRRRAGGGRHAAVRRRGAGVLGARRPRGQRGVRLHVAGAGLAARVDKVVGCDHPHVRAVPAHAARRPRRRRGGQPQAADPGRLRPADRPRAVQLAAAGAAGAAQDREDRPRGDERHRRAGDPAARPAAAGAVRDDEPLDRVRRRRVPAARTGAATTTCSGPPTRSSSP